MENLFKQISGPVGDLIDRKMDALESRVQARMLNWGADFIVWLAGVAATSMREKAVRLQQGEREGKGEGKGKQDA